MSLNRCALVVGIVALASQGHAAVVNVLVDYSVHDTTAIPTPAFNGATAGQVKHTITFDPQGPALLPGAGTDAWAPIPTDYFLSQGVRLYNLDIRKTTSYLDGPQYGAWHSGFPNPVYSPFSFVFTQPVASFGMRASLIELTVLATLSNGDTQSFQVDSRVSSNSNFVACVAPGNVITRLDFSSGDYNYIDDIQFSYAPEPASAAAVAGAGLILARRRRRSR